ncbi:MAG: sulfite exporter TauE/SafE family protein [Candidatus Bathyarchaeota archaeon]|nr:sulfite exporter TauE/SafE family protein [Candidatus Bathyarchaeota archaeon]
MSLMTEISNPFIASFALGLFSGLVFCTSACLPYITGYIAGIGSGFRKSVLITATYNGGRITAYASIGLAISITKLSIGEAFFSSYQNYALAALGAVSTTIGLNMIYKSKKHASCVSCPTSAVATASTQSGRIFDPQVFLLGLTRGLIVCPLITPVLVYSATTIAPTDSFFLATLFGVGTAVSPLLLIGGVTGWLLNKAPLFRKWISIAGGLTLIGLGINAFVNAATAS